MKIKDFEKNLMAEREKMTPGHLNLQELHILEQKWVWSLSYILNYSHQCISKEITPFWVVGMTELIEFTMIGIIFD